MLASLSPLLLVAVAFAFGDVLGLLTASSADAAPLGAVAMGVGLVCAGAGVFWTSSAGVSRGLVTLAVLLAGSAGFMAGHVFGRAARTHCVTDFQTGAPAVATGTLGDLLPAREIDRSVQLARTFLWEATVVSGGSSCRMRKVRVFARLDDRVSPGTHVIARGVWRSPDAGRLPRPPEASGWLTRVAVSPASPPESDPTKSDSARPATVRDHLIKWRATLLARLDERLSAGGAEVGKAMLLADRSTMNPATRDVFVGAGIIHLLAISGLHVGLIGTGLAWIIGLRVRGTRGLLYAAAATTVYVVMIGAPPSAVRAILMFWGWVLTRSRACPARISDLAALAALLALLFNPLIVTDIGFQLSFAGFTGVVLGGRVSPPGFLRGIGKRARSAFRALAVSMGAFVFTAPLTAWHFDRLVLASIPASTVAGVVVGLALPALSLALVLPLGLWIPFAGAADVLIVCLVKIASLFAAMPLTWSGPQLDAYTWGAIGLMGLVLFERRRGRRGLAIMLAGIVLAGSIAMPSWRALQARGKALVCTLDVGQGDAAVARTSSGRWLVFDAGPAFENGLARFLRRMGVREIDVLTISHPHLDHFGGAAEVFDQTRVHSVLDPGIAEPTTAYLDFLHRVQEEEAHWGSPRMGDTVRVDDVEIVFLWPAVSAVTDGHLASDDPNDGSLAFRLKVGDFTYMNTGDASVEVEDTILSRYPESSLDADVVKMGHHGSRTSSSLAWLQATTPEIAVISAGSGNRYGHPHSETLHRLELAQVTGVWRTDEGGSLCVQIDGEGWRTLGTHLAEG